MPWPLSQDYNEAIQNPGTSLGDPELQGGDPVTGPLGMPMPRSGNFADVYEFVGASGAKWAIKCFTRAVPGLRERYTEISKHLVQAKLPFTVDFEFLVRGIRIRGDWYPVLKMQWVEGFLLNEFVRHNLNKPALLDGLGQIWLRMGKCLRDVNMAHADLQHGNVILAAKRNKAGALPVKLIDYDGMWVPALANKKSGEAGHPNYQHPQRLQDGTYTADVDRLPLLVVSCALRCLVVGGKSLWDRHDNGDNLLFREADLKAPGNSPLFKELRELPDPQARMLVEELQKALAGKLEDVPFIDRLLQETTPASVPAPASPPPPMKPVEPPAAPRLPTDLDQVTSVVPPSVPVPAGSSPTVKASEPPAAPRLPWDLAQASAFKAGAPNVPVRASPSTAVTPVEAPVAAVAPAPPQPKVPPAMAQSNEGYYRGNVERVPVLPGEPSAIARSPWEFDKVSAPEPAATAPAQRSGIPVWALAAGGGVAAVTLVVLVAISIALGFLLKPANEGDFLLRVEPAQVKVAQGANVKLKVVVSRKGYEGPIELEIRDLPPQVMGPIGPRVTIARGVNSIDVELTAAITAGVGDSRITIMGSPVAANKQKGRLLPFMLSVTATAPLPIPKAMGPNPPEVAVKAENPGGDIVIAEAKHPINGLFAELFEGRNLQRKLKIRRDDQIDWLWGLHAPDPDVPPGEFSIRWTGWLKAPAPGQYRLIVHSDDGVRVWLDQKLIINQWRLQSAPRLVADVKLGTGPHALKVEYFNGGGTAMIFLRWEQKDSFPEQAVPREALFFDKAIAEKTNVTIREDKSDVAIEGKAPGLLAELYRGERFQTKVKSRIDARVDFMWGEEAPDPELPADHFSIRWTGWLKVPAPGRYTLITGSDDGVQLSIDGKLVIYEWHGQTPTRHSADVDLSEGLHKLEILYFEIDLTAMMTFRWEQENGFKEQVVPASALFHDRGVAGNSINR